MPLWHLWRVAKGFSVCAVLATIVHAASANADDPLMHDRPSAVLRVLDKQTARVEERDAKVGQPFRFGSLSLLVRTCKDAAAEDRPEAAVFIEVKEVSGTGQEEAIYSGWMFASSPALAAMEHPVYDVWVTGCKGAAIIPAKPDAATLQVAPPSDKNNP